MDDPCVSFSFWAGTLNRRKGSNVQGYFSQEKPFSWEMWDLPFTNKSKLGRMTINTATRSAVHTGSVVCATRKGSTLPQGGGAEADSLATQVMEKLWEQLLLTGSVLTPLSSSSTQNYFCSSPFSLIQQLIDHGLYHGLYVRNYARLSGQFHVPDLDERTLFLLFLFITWTSPHSPSSF